MPLALFPQAGGDAGIRQTLDSMARLVNSAFLDPTIRDQAAYAIGGCERNNRACQCYSVMSWVGRMVRYVRDPTGVELLHDPRLIGRAIAGKKLVYGDCDDMSMYLASLLKSVGLQPIIRAVGYNGRPFQHVYIVCQGVKLDATRSGWTPVTFYEQHETSVMEKVI